MPLKEVLRLCNITKSFPGVQALSDVSFDLREGEVHCICGENGAGKSTLIKIISGAYEPDAGTIEVNSQVVKLDPKKAHDHGIQTIYQEHNVFQHLTVTENIFTGLEVSKLGVVQKKEMERRTREALEQLHCYFDPSTMMSDLSSSEKKMVEIGKALVFNRKIIILDEPTSSFSSSEIDNLLHIIEVLKEKGMGIIYISHHLDEVFKTGDRVTVLRDGRVISNYDICDIDEEKLIRDMVGRDASAFYNREFFKHGEVILEAKRITGNGVEDVSFSLRRGEILGVAGMVGSGRSELMNLLFGAEPLESGELVVLGKKVNFKAPENAIKHKMCFITEDRQFSGLFLTHSIARNTVIANLANEKRIFIHPKEDIALGDEYIKRTGAKAENALVQVVNLSGGNQQKVVLGKWFLTNGEIFIFDEPTRGIDVGSKQEIYSIMLRLLKENKAIIMVSSDMPEVISMSDRIIVMKDGRLVAELERDEISEESVLKNSIGGKTDDRSKKKCS